MNVVFDWDEKAQCWEHKTEERVVYIHKIPESKYLITIGDISATTQLFVSGGTWKSYISNSMWDMLNIVEEKLNAGVKFHDPNFIKRENNMLDLLKTVVEMVKTVITKHANTSSTNDAKVKELKLQIMALEKRNKALVAEQNEALEILKEIASYLEQH